MTKDEKKILLLIAPLAPSESDMIWIDFKNNRFMKVGAKEQEEHIADFSKYSPRIRVILNALEEKQCIIRSSPFDCADCGFADYQRNIRLYTMVANTAQIIGTTHSLMNFFK